MRFSKVIAVNLYSSIFSCLFRNNITCFCCIIESSAFNRTTILCNLFIVIFPCFNHQVLSRSCPGP